MALRARRRMAPNLLACATAVIVGVGTRQWRRQLVANPRQPLPQFARRCRDSAPVPCVFSRAIPLRLLVSLTPCSVRRHHTNRSWTPSGALRLQTPPDRVPNALVLCVMLLELGVRVE